MKTSLNNLRLWKKWKWIFRREIISKRSFISRSTGNLLFWRLHLVEGSGLWLSSRYLHLTLVPVGLAPNNFFPKSIFTVRWRIWLNQKRNHLRDYQLLFYVALYYVLELRGGITSSVSLYSKENSISELKMGLTVPLLESKILLNII